MLIDAAERFPLGDRNGMVRPTAEPVSDTAATPFGLTLRTAPALRNVLRVRSAEGMPMMGNTDRITLITSDGSGEDKDLDTDYETD